MALVWAIADAPDNRNKPNASAKAIRNPDGIFIATPFFGDPIGGRPTVRCRSKSRQNVLHGLTRAAPKSLDETGRVLVPQVVQCLPNA